MVRTVNRMPASISTPGRGDVDDKFFNHYDWKGVNDSKNFFSVDPFTFADSNNVYADSEGLLRSRPATKIQTITDGEIVLSNIVDAWTFDEVVVYKSEFNGTYYLTFISKKFNRFVQKTTHENVNLLSADRKIFVFSEVDFNYYDMDENTYNSADSFIHIPTTKIITDGITTTENESQNILTDSYITKYLFSTSKSNLYNDFVGKDVTVKVDGEEYKITFIQDNELVFVEKYASLTDENFITNTGDTTKESVIGYIPPGYKYPLVFASEKQSMIVCKYNTITTGYAADKTSNTTWTIYHTVDGVTYNILPTISNVVGIPIISKDGNYCIVFCSNGPYIISLLDTVEGGRKYPNWTNLLQRLDSTWYVQNFFNKITLNNRKTYFGNSDLFQNTSINGYFLDDTTFAFVFIDFVESEPRAKCISCQSAVLRIANISYPYTNGEQTVTMWSYNSSWLPNVRVCEYKDSKSDNFCVLLEFRTGIIEHETFVTEWKMIYTILATKTFGGESYRIIHTVHDYIPVRTFSVEGFPGYIAADLPMTNDDILLNENVVSIAFNGTDDTQAEQYIAINNYKVTKNNVSEFISGKRINDKHCIMKLSANTGYLLTDEKLYTVEPTATKTKFIPLLFKGIPAGYFTAGNSLDSVYICTDDGIYTNIVNKPVEIDVLTTGKTNYLLFSHDTFLDNYYVSKGHKLYISSKLYNLEEDKYYWYFPKIAIQDFDYNITNLHVISEDTVGIFFENSIQYVTFDYEAKAYRYYKSKLDVGCKEGGDVITTFDGKHTIFNTVRGLVAMSYQDFIASDEQALSYLTDTIYDMYNKYNDSPMKLYPYGYWIFVYKINSNKMFVLDIRNNSWWPMTLLYPLSKVILDDKPQFLLNNCMNKLDVEDGAYYDYDGKQHKINWFIRSQKLYLKAINYYKHIVNMTFVSVHDTENIIESNNIDDTGYKLTVNIYRKKINGNIGTDDYTTIDYNIENIRTFVQRLNYSKVNEFEYMLESDDERAFDVPLSLSSITIKYKIGGQVR